MIGNFRQYGLLSRYLDGFVCDLTNSPIRNTNTPTMRDEMGMSGRKKEIGVRWLDAIVCDPPYGVREGLKVLGSTREDLQKEIRLPDGTLAHL